MSVYASTLLSPFISPSPSPPQSLSISLFSMSASLSLLCEQVPICTKGSYIHCLIWPCRTRYPLDRWTDRSSATWGNRPRPCVQSGIVSASQTQCPDLSAFRWGPGPFTCWLNVHCVSGTGPGWRRHPWPSNSGWNSIDKLFIMKYIYSNHSIHKEMDR